MLRLLLDTDGPAQLLPALASLAVCVHARARPASARAHGAAQESTFPQSDGASAKAVHLNEFIVRVIYFIVAIRPSFTCPAVVRTNARASVSLALYTLAPGSRGDGVEGHLSIHLVCVGSVSARHEAVRALTVSTGRLQAKTWAEG
jgi:hypothetical protein